MREFKKETRIWFGWDPEKIEDYLEGMSARGWHAVSADGMLVSYLFERGEPKRIRYCMDYQREEKAEYGRIFEDDGWTLLQKGLGWYLWSKEYEGARPGIYTDAESLIARNRNILLSVSFVLITQMPLIFINAQNLAHVLKTSPAVFVLLAAILAASYAALVYCIVRLLLSIRRLRARAGGR